MRNKTVLYHRPNQSTIRKGRVSADRGETLIIDGKEMPRSQVLHVCLSKSATPKVLKQLIATQPTKVQKRLVAVMSPSSREPTLADVKTAQMLHAVIESVETASLVVAVDSDGSSNHLAESKPSLESSTTTLKVGDIELVEPKDLVIDRFV